MYFTNVSISKILHSLTNQPTNQPTNQWLVYRDGWSPSPSPLTTACEQLFDF